MEAISAAQETRPALVLLDIMMPKKSGIHVLRYMRRDPDLRNIPVLRVSEAIDVHDPMIRIDRRDRHPSADTHRRLAEFLVERVVEPQFAESAR